MMQCPKCGGTEFWDNRATKRNPKAPDYRCKQKECDGAVWLTPRGGGAPAYPTNAAPAGYDQGDPGPYEFPAPRPMAAQGIVPQAPLRQAAPQQAQQPVQQQLPLQAVVTVAPEDLVLMGSCLSYATDLVLNAIHQLDTKAQGNDIVFTGDNICSVAASLFIETRRRAR